MVGFIVSLTLAEAGGDGALVAGGLSLVALLQIGNMIWKGRGDRDQGTQGKLDGLLSSTATITAQIASLNAKVEASHLERVATEARMHERVDEVDRLVRGGEDGQGAMSRIAMVEREVKAQWRKIDELQRKG